MGLGFRVFRIIFMRLKPLVSKRAWNMFSLKMLGWDLFEEKCSQSTIPQIIHLNICSCSSLRRGGNVAAFMIICHIFHEKTSSSTQNQNLYPAASVSFSEPWQHILHLSTHSFKINERSLKSPCNAPGLTPKLC